MIFLITFVFFFFDFMMTDWKRNSILFLGGQALSMFGSMLVQYAIFWHVTLSTESGSMMTVYVIVGLLPTFFVSPFGGVWADRYNRKKLICLSDGGIATVTLLIAVAFFAGYRELWLIFLCAAMRAVGEGIQSPAVTSFIPQIVPEDKLTKVNGINTSIQSAIALLAPAVSGTLLTFISLEYLFFIDIITALTGIGILLFLVKTPFADNHSDESRATGTNYFGDLRDGLKYIWREKWVFQIIILSTIMFAAMSPGAFLTPLQVIRNFGNEVWRLSAIEIAFSGGMLLGGLLMGFWGGFRNKMYSMAVASVVIGIGTVLLGVLTDFWLYLAAWTMVGLTVPLSNTPCTVILQTKTDPDYMGRVFGVFGMTYSLTMPLAMLVFGPLADVIEIDWMLIATGAVYVVLCVPYLTSRSLRKIGKECK
ncbi:MAG: MFS transporter [Dysgonamonadaceae bacterium]|nr:MFS transporter [Dysgonamonadaceae bacterium]